MSHTHAIPPPTPTGWPLMSSPPCEATPAPSHPKYHLHHAGSPSQLTSIEHYNCNCALYLFIVCPLHVCFLRQ